MAAEQQNDIGSTLLKGAAVAWLAAALLLVAFPEADLAASGVFYASGQFAGNRMVWVELLRRSFVWLFWLCATVAIVGLAVSMLGNSSWLRLARRQWLFVVICLCAGPGLVANILLKDQWGRARPREIVEFGGQRTFTPALIPTRQCERNCSFVSGEASSIFALFYAAARAIPQWGIALMAAGTLVGGCVVGGVRISQGAHFASDVAFAGMLMALTTVLVHYLVSHWSWPALLAGRMPWARQGPD